MTPLTEHEREIWERLATIEADLRGLNRRLDDTIHAQLLTNEKQNEFRAALEDQAKRVERDQMPRREFDVQHAALVDRIEIASALWQTDRTSLARAIDDGLSAARLSLADQPRMTALERGQSTSSGERSGHISTISMLIAGGVLFIGALGFIATVVFFIVAR